MPTKKAKITSRTAAAPTTSGEPKPETTRQPSLFDLLMEDLSWDVIKQVMKFEIPLPFSARTADLADEELGSAFMSKEQHEEIARNRNLLGDKIGHILVQQGEITRDQFDQAKRLRKRTGQPIWRTLMQLQLVRPAQIARVCRAVLPAGSLPDSKFTQWLVGNKRTTRCPLETKGF